MAKNDITVKLSKARVIGSAGFGVPLIIQGKANAAKDYAEYDSLDAVLEKVLKAEQHCVISCYPCRRQPIWRPRR